MSVNKLRRHDFYDTVLCLPLYGIDARLDTGEWCHLAQNGQPYTFETPEARDAEMKKLRARIRQQNKMEGVA